MLGMAQAIEPGYNANTLPPNDDASTGLVSIGFTVNFFGITRTEVYVNNNGNITFDSPLGSFTPFDLTSTGQEIIAPFFADVDTRSAGDPVTYGPGTFNGRPAFGVNYVNVDYFPSNPANTNRNSFQVILVDRSDVGAGDFDIIFNYDQIQWETGGASGGDGNGLGGSSARVGFSNGTGAPGTAFELPGSAINGAFLDGGPNALISNRLNSNLDGRYVFQSRGGGIPVPGPSDDIPAPLPVPVGGLWVWLLLGLMLMLVAVPVLRRT
ncbi:MAG: nidogen-like domain-containing protein [Wenzhouxiangella sp.]